MRVDKLLADKEKVGWRAQMTLDALVDKRHEWRKVIRNTVNSPAFEVCSSLVIGVNLVMVGIAADLYINGLPFPWMISIERSFLFIYTVEILLRLLAQGPEESCTEPPGRSSSAMLQARFRAAELGKVEPSWL